VKVLPKLKSYDSMSIIYKKNYIYTKTRRQKIETWSERFEYTKEDLEE
jgi:hypothetical protein